MDSFLVDGTRSFFQDGLETNFALSRRQSGQSMMLTLDFNLQQDELQQLIEMKMTWHPALIVQPKVPQIFRDAICEIPNVLIADFKVKVVGNLVTEAIYELHGGNKLRS